MRGLSNQIKGNLHPTPPHPPPEVPGVCPCSSGRSDVARSQEQGESHQPECFHPGQENRTRTLLYHAVGPGARRPSHPGPTRSGAVFLGGPPHTAVLLTRAEDKHKALFTWGGQLVQVISFQVTTTPNYPDSPLGNSVQNKTFAARSEGTGKHKPSTNE